MRRLDCCLLLFAAAACADDDPPGIPIDTAPREIAKSVCPKAYACCTPELLADNDRAGSDEASCEVATEEGFRNTLSAVKVSVDRGRAVYRGDKVESCLAYIRSQPCEVLNVTNRFSGVPDCGAFVEAKTALGDPCAFDWDCIEGSCDKGEDEPEGVCVQKAKQGQFCASISCLEGLVCDPADQTCKPQRAAGETCASSIECTSGHCTKTGTVAGTCDAPTADKCFYASACTTVIRGPGDAALFAGLLIVLALMSRKKRC